MGFVLSLVCPGMVNSAVSTADLLPPEVDPWCVLPSEPWQPQITLVLGWYQPAAVQGKGVGIDSQSSSPGTPWTRLSRVPLFLWARPQTSPSLQPPLFMLPVCTVLYVLQPVARPLSCLLLRAMLRVERVKTLGSILEMEDLRLMHLGE